MYKAPIILAFSEAGSSDSVAIAVELAAIAFLLWKAISWFICGPAGPDPWDEKIAADIEGEEGVPVCHRCLVPHDPGVDFCPDCGAPVGTYTNWLPFPYLFSLGHSLRVGTDGSFKRTPFTIFGFMALGFVEYGVFAPIYWFMLRRNVARLADLEARPDSSDVEPPVPPSPGGAG